MKGTLINKNGQWFIQYWEQLLPPNENRKIMNEKPLHPDELGCDEKIETLLSQKENKEVEFEIVEEGDGKYFLQGQKGVQEGKIKYAKLLWRNH